MKIGEVAACAGVTVDTIRFYERRGLLARAPRTAAGYRTYSGGEVERLRLIKFLQGLEVSLDDIAVMLRMLDGGKATCANQTPRFEAVVERIDRDIRRLQEARKTIRDLLAFCGTGQCLLVDGEAASSRMRNTYVTCSGMDAVAQALTDPIRRAILLMLRDQPRNAGELAAVFAVSRPAISRHLRVLREAGLVSDELIGRERTYRLTLESLGELAAFIAELHAPSRWKRRFAALGTEVQRVKRRGRRTRQAGEHQYNRRDTA